MTVPRSNSMTVGEIETHHVWSRCVQRAMLCGVDPRTGMDFSYRREILQQLIEYQTSIFAVELGNYTILGNHFHLLPRSRPDIAKTWSDEEVAWRYKVAWPRLENNRWVASPTDEAIREVLDEANTVARARAYLGSISGYVARIKEPVAKQFNSEMRTKGHYWEARFGNRRLETFEESLSCSFYLDLNHLRAGAADSLAGSHRSAIQDRLLAEQSREQWVQENSRESWERVRSDLEHGSPDIDPRVLEELFRDCWLAPITPDSPLSTQEMSTTTVPTTVVTPSRIEIREAEVRENKGREGSGREEFGQDDPSTNDASEQAGSEHGSDKEASVAHEGAQPTTDGERPEASSAARQCGTFAARRPGRPRRRPSRSIHWRYLERLKRRQSNHCFLETTWEAYKETVQALADQILAHRLPPPQLHDPWQSTVSSWWSDVRDFARSIAAVIAPFVPTGQAALSPGGPSSSIDPQSLPPPPG